MLDSNIQQVYIDSLLKFETIVLSQFFSSKTPLSMYLQTKVLDIFQTYKMVKQTMNTLNKQFRYFESILEAQKKFLRNGQVCILMTETWIYVYIYST